MDRKVRLFNIDIDDVTMTEAVERIIRLAQSSSKHYVVTPNVDHIVNLNKDDEFMAVYNDASMVLADGQILLWASKLLKRPITEKVSGSDLFPIVCKNAMLENLPIFFLGGEAGVAEEAKRKVEILYPGIKINGTYDPPFGFEHDENENKKIIEIINNSGVKILFIGLGSPKQEKWIYHHIHNLNINIALCVGASFDFIAGTKKRAPKWVQQSGLEWFYRFLHEPRRLFKRYFLDDLQFLPIFMEELLSKKKKNIQSR